MSITHLSSVSELNGVLAKSKDKLTVIDFHATWCGPCHVIAPVFEALSKQYKNVTFLKCDVDAAPDVASRYSISAMPTFVFLKGGIKIDELKGANKSALQDAVRRHSTSSPSSSFSGKGQTLGGEPAPGNVVQGIKDSVHQATAKVTTKAADIDPQVKILLGLVGIYLVFWYFS